MDDPKAICNRAKAKAWAVREKAWGEAKDIYEVLADAKAFYDKVEAEAKSVRDKALVEALVTREKAWAEAENVYCKACAEAKAVYDKTKKSKEK